MDVLDEAMDIAAQGTSRPGMPCSVCRLMAHVGPDVAAKLEMLLRSDEFSDPEMMALLRRHPDWPKVGFQQLGVHRRGKCGGKS